MNKLYNLCVATRKYSANGEEKTNWENVGGLFQNDEGKKFIMLKAHFNPAAIKRKENSESILISMFKPKQNQSGQQNNSARQTQNQQDDWDYNQGFSGGNDDIPF